MWQTEVTGCGVLSSLEEMMRFSRRARHALNYGLKDGIPPLTDADRPMLMATAHLSAKALYDKGSKKINHGVMVVGQLFVYTGPRLYISWEPKNEYTWLISIAHLNSDGSVDDALKIPPKLKGTTLYRWYQVPGPVLDEPIPAGRFGTNLLHE